LTGFVLDASVVMTWAFPDEDDAGSLAIMRRLRAEPARVPAVWWFEVRNVLLVNERRQRITADDATAFLRSLAGLPIEIAPIPDSDRIMALGRRHRLTAYDCAYLEIALRDGLPLATLDAQLAAAARREGIPVVP
jgi:predicted nucleic acid-binding protein